MGRPQFATRRQPALVSYAGFTWELERDLFAPSFPTGDVIAGQEKSYTPSKKSVATATLAAGPRSATFIPVSGADFSDILGGLEKSNVGDPLPANPRRL